MRRLVGALTIGALVLAACGGDDEDDASDDAPAEETSDDDAEATDSTEAADEPAEDAGGESTRIFMAPKFTGLAYFEVARVGGEDAAEDYPIEFEYIGSDKPEATEQIATLTNAIPQQPDALVVSAIDGDAVAPALRDARDEGIAVVTYDADAAVDARDLFVNQLSYELAAETMLEA
ncbi:MAG: substrate-binding domain-containing protein, partial [Ilumatobacter fluminis]